MAIRRILVKFLRNVNALTDELIDRLLFLKEMREWELQKRKEGFPKEWFEEE